jgi:hypothetical protein
LVGRFLGVVSPKVLDEARSGTFAGRRARQCYIDPGTKKTESVLIVFGTLFPSAIWSTGLFLSPYDAHVNLLEKFRKRGMRLAKSKCNDELSIPAPACRVARTSEWGNISAACFLAMWS